VIGMMRIARVAVALALVQRNVLFTVFIEYPLRGGIVNRGKEIVVARGNSRTRFIRCPRLRFTPRN